VNIIPTQLTRSVDPKPLYALAGASDLVVEQLRALPARIADLRPAVSLDAGDLRAVATDLTSRVAVLPFKATATYAELAGRGRKVVRSVSRQQATQELKAEVSTTARRTKTATKTARTSATATRASTKKAATSAARTAGAATKAVKDGAAKVG
jgi:hypothetical protein